MSGNVHARLHVSYCQTPEYNRFLVKFMGTYLNLVVTGIELHLSARAVPHTLLWAATTLASMATLLALVASTAEGFPTDAVTLEKSDAAGYCCCL